MGKELSNRSNGFDREQEKLRMNRAIGASLPIFGDETAANEVIPITLVNSDTVNHLIAIHAGDLTKLQIASILGVTVDAIATEAVDTITGKVTCTTEPGTQMEYIQKFVNRNPTRVIRMQISASSEEQLNQSIVIAGVSPFRKVGQKKITPSAYKKESNQNVKLVTVTLKDLQLDDQTVVYVNLLAGATLSLNLMIGTVSNSAAVLDRQARVYYGN